MPLDFCHPEAPHKKLRMPEWYVSSLMMDRALDAVMRRVKKFDRQHDIPYLAGYSQDGKTIYIDRHMPAEFKFRGRAVETDRFLVLHEEVEKTLIDRLGLHYLHAHQLLPMISASRCSGPCAKLCATHKDANAASTAPSRYRTDIEALRL
jgi:hypothetical protein